MSDTLNISINELRLPPPEDIMVQFTKVQNQRIITWNVLQGTDKQIFYNVYRGLAHNGIFYKQNLQPLATNKFIDYNVSNNPNITYWYKVSSVYLDNGVWIEGIPSQAVQYRVNNFNKWFNKINERNMWILKMDGELFDLYTRKYEGEHCPDCYSDTRGRASQKACTTCYGTGFVGGFEPRTQIYIRIVPVEESLSIETESYRYNKQQSMWTISPIQIRNRDLLIGPDGIFYTVLSSYINKVSGYTFHQDLKTKTLEPNDPLYSMKRTTLQPAY